MAKGLIIAIVGMPGAGKSEAAAYLQKHGIPFLRFGQLTDETVSEMGLPLTSQNERVAREKLRQEFGMAAYAIKAEPKIETMLQDADVIALDGLYSWEEYVYLKEKFSQLTLIQVYAEPQIRYKRLAERKIRPVAGEDARMRDVLELEKLNKGGPIAIADHLIENDSGDITLLQQKLDELLSRLGIQV